MQSCTGKRRKDIKRLGSPLTSTAKKTTGLFVKQPNIETKRQPTGHLNTRHNINAEIAEVAEHLAAGHIVWNAYYVRRLFCNYPRRPKVDAVVQNLGEDFAHDSIHNLSDVEDDNGD